MRLPSSSSSGASASKKAKKSGASSMSSCGALQGRLDTSISHHCCCKREHNLPVDITAATNSHAEQLGRCCQWWYLEHYFFAVSSCLSRQLRASRMMSRGYLKQSKNVFRMKR